MPSDEIRINGVAIGRVSCEMSPRRCGKTAAIAARFRTDHVGMMVLGAKLLDKGDDQ